MLSHNEDTDLNENLLGSSLTFDKRLFLGMQFYSELNIHR